MKPNTLTLIAAAAAIAAPGMLWALSEADTDGDGLVDVAELQAVFPDLTETQFEKMDLNADGGLDADEIAAAQLAGQLPSNES
ncbi:EF-hand domain-containing protein [Pseudodonghicola flavimaris]|uniref:EF-hand domain-containing protein n=1 Tax=Pseudodonghicola flavimaris TaxID=3050036 RepID=A0ABT7EVS4_9RHOB|nr:hypothetical protein [Pseudodonghicola flavimaris]MDK3016451.1 hypothetical protein [Pseudodonghicola flavimaris]